MYLNAVNVSPSLKMIKRKNILILRHMELLERTRLGITSFLDSPTVRRLRMIVVKVVAHGDFFYFLREDTFFSNLKLALISDFQLNRVISIAGSMTSKELRKFDFHVEVNGTSSIPKRQ